MVSRQLGLAGFIAFLLLGAALTASSAAEAGKGKYHVLMIAGPPSHGYGAHEHYAGLKVLEEQISKASDKCAVTVVRGWPDDESLVDQADTIVIYSDGGGRHLAIPHRDRIRAKMNDGCGLVCIHYAVEMTPGEPGDDWVDLLGGHFEVHWSVNPHWVAEFDSLPKHEITQGVQPFSANDEWYFHMRFNSNGKVVPILAAVAPPETMRRGDGPHSGNPHVRKSVAAAEPQTLAWAYERPEGGRAFGFTGGHFHWNWGSENYRRLLANAIRWTAGEPIEATGSGLTKVGIEMLLKNQDFDQPQNFNPEETAKRYNVPKLGDSADTAVKPKP